MYRLKDGSIIESGWTKKDWFAFQEKLSRLTLEELFSLATVTGLFFDAPMQELKKEDFILSLDEVDRQELEKVYKLIIKNRKSKKH